MSTDEEISSKGLAKSKFRKNMLRKTFKSQLTLSRNRRKKASNSIVGKSNQEKGEVKQATLTRKAWKLLSKSTNLFGSSSNLNKNLSQFEFEFEIDRKSKNSLPEQKIPEVASNVKERSSNRDSNKSFMNTLRKQGTLRRKKKVKQTKEYSEVSLSNIVVTRRGSDSTIPDDKSQEMLRIRESFKESERGHINSVHSFREAKKYFSQFQLDLSGSNLDQEEKKKKSDLSSGSSANRKVKTNSIDDLDGFI